MSIKQGDAATYVGEAFDFLTPNSTVFVRMVGEHTAYVQNPWDSHDRITVDLTDLVEKTRR